MDAKIARNQGYSDGVNNRKNKARLFSGFEGFYQLGYDDGIKAKIVMTHKTSERKNNA